MKMSRVGHRLHLYSGLTDEEGGEAEEKKPRRGSEGLPDKWHRKCDGECTEAKAFGKPVSVT